MVLTDVNPKLHASHRRHQPFVNHATIVALFSHLWSKGLLKTARIVLAILGERSPAAASLDEFMGDKMPTIKFLRDFAPQQPITLACELLVDNKAPIAWETWLQGAQWLVTSDIDTENPTLEACLRLLQGLSPETMHRNDRKLLDDHPSSRHFLNHVVAKLVPIRMPVKVSDEARDFNPSEWLNAHFADTAVLADCRSAARTVADPAVDDMVGHEFVATLRASILEFLKHVPRGTHIPAWLAQLKVHLKTYDKVPTVTTEPATGGAPTMQAPPLTGADTSTADGTPATDGTPSSVVPETPAAGGTPTEGGTPVAGDAGTPATGGTSDNAPVTVSEGRGAPTANATSVMLPSGPVQVGQIIIGFQRKQRFVHEKMPRDSHLI